MSGPVVSEAAGDGAARLRAQLLTERPPYSAGEVVRHLLAVQAQDGRGARLALRARSSRVGPADLEEALGRRELVVSWLNRGTLHLVAAEDYWWLHALTTPQLATGVARRLRQEGVTAAQARRGVEVVGAAVADGPKTRAQLRVCLDAAGIPTAGQALVHILAAATLEGHVVRGPMRGKEQAFVAVNAWLGPAPLPLERNEALARLARRYLAGHAPATDLDLAKWAGITRADARRGLAAVAEAPKPSAVSVVSKVGKESAEGLPPPRLLGAFDPVLLGWASRAPLVGRHKSVVTTNGVFRPVVLVQGRVAGTWALPAGQVTITALERISKAHLSRLEADAADVLRYLGLPDRPLSWNT